MTDQFQLDSVAVLGVLMFTLFIVILVMLAVDLVRDCRVLLRRWGTLGAARRARHRLRRDIHNLIREVEDVCRIAATKENHGRQSPAARPRSQAGSDTESGTGLE